MKKNKQRFSDEQKNFFEKIEYMGTKDFTKLHLNFNNLENIPKVFNSLSKRKNVKEIEFISDVYIKELDFKKGVYNEIFQKINDSFDNFFENNTTLKSFRIEFTDSHFFNFTSLKLLKKIPTLEKLAIYIDLSQDSIRDLGELISKGNLKELEIVYQDKVLRNIKTYMKNTKNLKSLTLKFINFSIVKPYESLLENTSLKSLILNPYELDIKLLSESLKNKELNHFTLQGYTFKNSDYFPLLIDGLNLKELKLPSLSDDVLIKLFKILIKKNIKQLLIEISNEEEKCFKEFGLTLRELNILEELTIYVSNDIECFECLKYLQYGLENHSSLKKLKISQTYKPAYEIVKFDDISFEKTQFINEYDFSDLNLTKEDVLKFLLNIKDHSNITKLNLSNSNLENSGKSLQKYLLNHKGLRKLLLRNTQLSDIDFEDISIVLQNIDLKKLDISKNDIDFNLICSFIRNNSSVTHFNFDHEKYSLKDSGFDQALFNNETLLCINDQFIHKYLDRNRSFIVIYYKISMKLKDIHFNF